MNILGLNAFGHDAAAVLLRDGEVVFASSEERFDRSRHSAAFPRRAIDAALAHAGLAPGEVDAIAFPWMRSMARWRKARYVLRHLPRSLAFLREAPPEGIPGRVTYLRAMRHLETSLRDVGLGAPLHRVEHHLAHAVSASLALPSGPAAVLTADGMGEWKTTATWRVDEGAPRLLRHADYPHSAGKAYSAVTQWLGFRPESGEGKTMGLAAYGDPDAPGAEFTRALLTHDPRSLLRVDVDRFGFPWGHQRLFGEAFVDALGPARAAADDLRAGDADAALGIQNAVEEVIGRVAEMLVAETGARALGLAGGLFLNCALNGSLRRRLSVPVHPFPVAGDAGAAWGAAAHVHHGLTGRRAAPLTSLELGHDLTPSEAASALGARVSERPADAAQAVASLVASGQLVGIARGRAEFGPRALGARSLLASPRSIAERDRLNEHKGRESWRPLAPVVREDDTTYFEELGPSPWMILTFAATAEAKKRIPGAIHADGSARVQTVSPETQPFLHAVLGALQGLGEPPVLLNTSFNRRGEPIVNTAEEALASAHALRLDAVLLADRLLSLSTA